MANLLLLLLPLLRGVIMAGSVLSFLMSANEISRNVELPVENLKANARKTVAALQYMDRDEKRAAFCVSWTRVSFQSR